MLIHLYMFFIHQVDGAIEKRGLFFDGDSKTFSLASKRFTKQIFGCVGLSSKFQGVSNSNNSTFITTEVNIHLLLHPHLSFLHYMCNFAWHL